MTFPAVSASLYLFPLATFCWSNWAPAAIRKMPTFIPKANCPWGPRSTFSCMRVWVYLSIRNLDPLDISLNHRILLSIECLTHTLQELLALHRGTLLAYFVWTARNRSPRSSPAHVCTRSWKCWKYSCNSRQCCRDPLSSMQGCSCWSLCALVSLVLRNCSSCINGHSRGRLLLRSSDSWSFAGSPSSACRLRNGLVQLTPGFSLIWQLADGPQARGRSARSLPGLHFSLRLVTGACSWDSLSNHHPIHRGLPKALAAVSQVTSPH